MSDQIRKIGFCSFCLGKKYCKLAQLLCNDVNKLASEMPFLILTSHPIFFADFRKVIAQKHRQQSLCYVPNDKVFLIERALSLFDSCTYIEADMRILDIGPRSFNRRPGIVARSCCNIMKHGLAHNKKNQIDMIKEIASKLEINLDNTKFLHEHLFTITKDEGREKEFIKYWKIIKTYFEDKEYHGGEGLSMGLAASKAGLPIYHDTFEGLKYFKECIEMEKIKKGQAVFEDMKEYFMTQRSIEYPKRNLFKKIVWNRFTKKYLQFFNIYYIIRLIRQKIFILRNFKFYYL